MPIGNDFSPIDPSVERLALTFDFSADMAVGETITSIVSVGATVTSGTDDDPDERLIGSPQITTGMSGGDSQAVIQLAGNCLANTVYLLQVNVQTSAGQELNCAGHLPCYPLV